MMARQLAYHTRELIRKAIAGTDGPCPCVPRDPFTFREDFEIHRTTPSQASLTASFRVKRRPHCTFSVRGI